MRAAVRIAAALLVAAVATAAAAQDADTGGAAAAAQDGGATGSQDAPPGTAPDDAAPDTGAEPATEAAAPDTAGEAPAQADDAAPVPAGGQAPVERVVAGLSQDQVAITATFTGSDILIFGAVQRTAPIPEGAPLHVVITVEGPDAALTIRRKERRVGIWVNVEAAEIDAAPAFYAVATTGPLSEVLTRTEDLRHGITAPQAIRAVGIGVPNPERFTEALIRLRERDNLYQVLEEAVTLREQTLFDTRITLPANLVEGVYDTRIFLTRDGQVISQYSTAIRVEKVGLERMIYDLAHDTPLLYGLVSLAIAIAAGWAASAIFRLIRS